MKKSILILVLISVFFISTNSHAVWDDMVKPTPELMSRGQEVFMTNCTTCHGVSGKGDGPAGIAFNPKPRNFTEETYKNGSSPSQIFKTISEGLGSMPNFSALSIQDRWSVVHYIHAMNASNAKDTPETLALLDELASQQNKTELPIHFIIDRMVEETK